MKNQILASIFAIFLSLYAFYQICDAKEIIVFGPYQYLRTTGSTNIFNDEFSAIPGDAKLIVYNGSQTGENRIEDAISSAKININGADILGPSDFNQNVYYIEADLSLSEQNTIVIELASAPDSYITVQIVQTVPNNPPVANDDTAETNEDTAVTIPVLPNDTDADGDDLVIDSIEQPANGTATDNGDGTVSYIPDSGFSGEDTFSYTISDGDGGTATANVYITVIASGTTPVVSISPESITIAQGDSVTLTWTATRGDYAYIDNGIGSVSTSGSITVNPEYTTIYVLTVTGPGGSTSVQAEIHVAGGPAEQPQGTFGYMYNDIIPEDAGLDFYEEERFAIVTGVVYDIDEIPLEGVSTTILNHPEYGTATTDGEGRYTLPVEGGGYYTVVFKKEGMIAAQRQVKVPWNDFAITDPIRMIEEDTANTTITFDGNAESVFTHQSTVISDDDGSRSATLVFSGDNTAYLVDENGNDIQTLSTITVRATEYTIPEVMPAELPPTSAFTYCTELSVDGVQRVHFEKPVVMWVDNFLGFPVGEIVPVGYYDRDRGVWVPSDNGVVVELLDTSGDGQVDAIDSDGDGVADDLDGDGDYSDEAQGLEDSGRYIPGASYWRSEIDHFTPWDCNWPYGPPDDAISPNATTGPDEDAQKTDQMDCKGSYNSLVEERSRIFHEDISIPDSGMTLHYTSNRVTGYKTVINVPVSGDTVPASLKSIVAKVQIAGRTFRQTMDPLPNQKAVFLWDGLDSLGNNMVGSATAYVSIGFVYNSVYYSTRNLLIQAFAQAGSNVTGIGARVDVTSWRNSQIKIKNGRGDIADGWTLSSHHQFLQNAFFKGDGSTLKYYNDIIKTVAGGGQVYSEGGPAVQAQIGAPSGVAVDASGNLYIAETDRHRILKVDTNGIVTTVAGTGVAGYSGDGGPAAQARLGFPEDVAIDASGNLYIADKGSHRIRKVNISGIITTVAGTTRGYSGDGGPAVQARLNWPKGVAVDAFGNLYIADKNNNCIRKVDSSGIITTVAGMGYYANGYSGDGGPAVQAKLGAPAGIAVDASGNLFIADTENSVIRKVDTSGIITKVAGMGRFEWGYSGDGGLAVQAQLSGPNDVVVDASGNIYIADKGNNCIRKVDSSGIIATVAGMGPNEPGCSGDGGPAIQSTLDEPLGLSLAPSGNIYIADHMCNRIREVWQTLPALSYAVSSGQLAFVDNDGLAYVIGTDGLHKRTIDLDTGVSLYSFSYDPQNRLDSITDQFGNQTVIQCSNGTPAEIISPNGLITQLTIDSSNHLTQITYPDGSYYNFEYTMDGLLTDKIDPDGNNFCNQFDSSGRLVSISDDEGGLWQYSRTTETNGDIVVKKLSAEGNLTTYRDHTDNTGAYTSLVTDPAGGLTTYNSSADRLSTQKDLSCGMSLSFKYDLDVEYFFKYLKQMNATTPAGLTRSTSYSTIYVDTNADNIPDQITKTVSVNESMVTTLKQNIENATKTITSPEGRVITSTYDPDTLLMQNLSISGLNDVTYGYDSQGRLTSVITGSRQTYFGYNSDGFLEWITDPENSITMYTRDPIGRVTGVSRPDGSMIDFNYDANGNMTVLTNPNSVDHGFSYDAVNKPIGYEPPLSGSYSYVYDKDRRLIRTNFPSGKQINNVYTDGLLTQIQTPEADIDLTYSCSSKIASISSVGETIEYGYDGKLLTDVTLGGTLNGSLSYTYNNDLNVTAFTYAGEMETFSYDLDGLLTESSGFTITRNAENGLPELVSGGSAILASGFNSYGELESSTLDISGNGIVAWCLERDDNGRITGKTETVGGITATYNYAYDAVGRLLNVTKEGTLVEEYEYDPNGVRIYEKNTLRGISGRNSTYSDEDQLLTSGAVTYQYDLDGFLTEKTDGSETTSYDYSSRGELLSMTLPNGSVIAYVHDPLGRRIAKMVNGTITEKYLWSGLTTLLAVYDGSDNLIQRFEYADSRMPIAMTRSGVTYYLGYDQVGTLRIVADTSGNVIKRIEYDSFGNVLEDTNEAFEVPFGFAGGFYDRDTGLVRFGYRDYDPDTGRWTAKDPIFFTGGDTDLYGYVQNDPVNWIDPWGLKVNWKGVVRATAKTISGVGIAAFGAGITIASGGVGGALGGAALGGVGGFIAWNGLVELMGALDVIELPGDENAGACEGFGSYVGGDTGKTVGKVIDTGIDIVGVASGIGSVSSVPKAIELGANIVNVADDIGAFDDDEK